MSGYFCYAKLIKKGLKGLVCKYFFFIFAKIIILARKVMFNVGTQRFEMCAKMRKVLMCGVVCCEI